MREKLHPMRSKTLTLTLAIAGTLALAGCGQGSIFNGSNWAVVNSASNAGSNLAISSTGAGNLIVVGLMFNGGTYATGISDDAGNTYVSANAKSSDGLQSTEIWYAVNSKPGATTVNPTFADSPTQVEITVWEISGMPNATPDVVGTANGSVTLANTTGPAVTTTKAGDLILSILFVLDTNVSGISSGNDFTNDFMTNGNGWAHITSNSSQVGTHQASWSTPSPQGAYCASTVAFRSGK